MAKPSYCTQNEGACESCALVNYGRDCRNNPLKLTTKQAAVYLGVNDSRIRQMILSGELSAEKMGRDWIIDRQKLDKLPERKPGRPAK